MRRDESPIKLEECRWHYASGKSTGKFRGQPPLHPPRYCIDVAPARAMMRVGAVDFGWLRWTRRSLTSSQRIWVPIPGILDGAIAELREIARQQGEEDPAVFVYVSTDSRRTCEVCGREFFGSHLYPASEDAPRAGGWHKSAWWGTKRTIRGLMFCSDACDLEHYRKQKREYMRTNRPSRAKNPSYTVACAECGEVFTAKRSDARHCSGTCRQRARRRR